MNFPFTQFKDLETMISKHILVSGLLLILLPNVGSSARRPHIDRVTDQLIRQIESRYGRMRGLAAEFEQVYSAPGMREHREHGRLILQRPRRMRWEYVSNPAKLFIVNGRDVWLYLPADREATHASVDSVSDARFPFLFLLGQTNLRREFLSITSLGTGSQPETTLLRLVPRSPSSGLREVLLDVFPDGRILRLKLVDQAGAASEVTLTKVRENFVAPAEAFEFHPPPGVTIRTQR